MGRPSSTESAQELSAVGAGMSPDLCLFMVWCTLGRLAVVDSVRFLQAAMNWSVLEVPLSWLRRSICRV